MGEQHLDTLPIVPRLLERCGTGQCASDIAGALMNAAWDFALGAISPLSELSAVLGSNLVDLFLRQ
jgi:hypothetical protein